MRRLGANYLCKCAETANRSADKKHSKSTKEFRKLIRETMEEHDLNVKTGWWYVKYIVDDYLQNKRAPRCKTKPLQNRLPNS